MTLKRYKIELMSYIETVKDNKIPFIAYDEALARFERVNRRSFIVIIVLIILLFSTNGAWLYFESQWQTTTTTVTQDNTDGYNSYIGNDGDINYGKADSNN